MILIELFAPPGALGAAQREWLARRMIDLLMASDQPDDSHAPEVLEAAQSLTQVLVHEPTTWVVGGQQPVDPADPPRYVVRVSTPAAWRKEMSGHVIEVLTQALAEAEKAAGRDPDRLLHEPHAWIHVTGVTEGSLGALGRPMGSLDLIRHLTAPHRDAIARRSAANLPPGHVVDPVCGMTVDLNTTGLTLEHDGTVHGFCDGQCLRIFAEDHGVSLEENRRGGVVQ
ncbi:ATPase [Streptomyces ferrugineus]|uniref:ATPase n=1 Tax=Streptomyces ferrugineus TaxID=1413221 RepID=A0A7M2SH56_9ACTN|nr:ATPase [Streptomyces ferrugineus]QOV34531.1 ATPase [Streptomyces ferrugineus]